MSVTIQLRGDIAANWTAVDPVPFAREMCLETDTGKIKVGDGITAWSALGYWNPGGGFASPMTTAGDMITGGSGGAPERLAIGSNGQVLGVVAGVPAYLTLTAASVGADASGAAAAAQTAAEAAAEAYAAATFIPLAQAGAESGVATLDTGGQVPLSELGNVPGGGGSASTRVWNALSNGLACDGVTDDTAAFRTLLTTVYNAGGGTIMFPAVSLILGQVTVPGNAGSPPKQVPIRLTGSAVDKFGSTSRGSTLYTNGGLDLRYAGRSDTGCGTTQGSATVTDPSAVATDLGFWPICPGVIPDRAQIISVTPGTGYTLSAPALATAANATFRVGGGRLQSFGNGSLEIDHLTLVSGAATSMPFGWSTNTVMSIHDCFFRGTATKSGSACDEDPWVFGGTQRAFTTGDPTQAFQGYGSRVTGNQFDHIRRVLLQEDCSSLWIANNVWWQTCGSNLANVTTLTTALTNGQTGVTSLAVAAIQNPVFSGDTMQIGNAGSAGTSPVQQVTASAYAAAGATSISVTSFTSNAAYATGTAVADYSTGLAAPLECYGNNTQANIASVISNRFEMDTTYTHATRMDYTSNAMILFNEIQDADSPWNMGAHRFETHAVYGLVIPTYVSVPSPLIDDANSPSTITVIDPRQSQPTRLPQGLLTKGLPSEWTDGYSPAIVDSSGNTWQFTASSGVLYLRYTPSGGSYTTFFQLNENSGTAYTFLATGATTYLKIQAGAAGAELYLGDPTYSTNVYIQNGWFFATHILATGTAPTVAAASGSTGAAIAGQDTAHNVSLTTAASISAGSSVATVTFNLSYNTSGRGPAKSPRFALTPKNQATALAQPYITGDSYTGYSIALASPPSGATAMAFDVTVMAS